ncbi:MAG: TlpA disulfide reductase family protein [Myxococcota bacterium]
MPHVAKLAARDAPRGLRFVTLNIDKDTFGINRFLADVQLNPPVLLDERGPVTSEPTTLLIDRRGVARFRHAGFDPHMQRALEAELEMLLGEPGP